MEPLHTSIPVWPFMCGMDIVGKLPRGSRQKEYAIFIMDYFMKWVEGEVFARINDVEVIQFIWKHVVRRFGIPQEIKIDNRPQFIS